MQILFSTRKWTNITADAKWWLATATDCGTAKQEVTNAKNGKFMKKQNKITPNPKKY